MTQVLVKGGRIITAVVDGNQWLGRPGLSQYLPRRASGQVL